MCLQYSYCATSGQKYLIFTHGDKKKIGQLTFGFGCVLVAVCFIWLSLWVGCRLKNLKVIKMSDMGIAHNNCAEFQNKLGDKFYAHENYEEAVKWFQKAADQGHAEAQFSLGVMYHAGLGVQKNRAESAKWHEKSSQQGNKKAQFCLAEMYLLGDGVTKDVDLGMNFLLASAKNGYVFAEYNLGMIYHKGEFVQKNNIEAMKWYQRAADKGHITSYGLLLVLKAEMAAKEGKND